MSSIHELLERAIAVGASDVHLKTGAEPFYRVNGELTESGFAALPLDSLMPIINEILPEYLHEAFAREHEADFSHNEQGVGRFRVNVFLSQGQPTVAMRHVKDEIPTFKGIRVPEQLAELAHVQRGIILLSGTTGSGKSTTLAAIIGEINRTQRRRIITVEDPVEYVFADDQSVITQREVGLDTLSFESSLKHLMRQDPDVILIGEMRDQETIATAITAAETGHLVITTLHTNDAVQTIDRILDCFPPHQQPQVRSQLAFSLLAVVAQRLIPTADGKGRAVACELLRNIPAVGHLIRDAKIQNLYTVMETHAREGMCTMDAGIKRLYLHGTISEEEAASRMRHPELLNKDTGTRAQ